MIDDWLNPPQLGLQVNKTFGGDAVDFLPRSDHVSLIIFAWGMSPRDEYKVAGSIVITSSFLNRQKRIPYSRSKLVALNP